MTNDNSTNDPSSLDDLRSMAHRKANAPTTKSESSQSADISGNTSSYKPDSTRKGFRNTFRGLALLGLIGIGFTWFNITTEDASTGGEIPDENIAAGEVTLPPIAQELELLSEGIKQYRNRNGYLPTTLAGLPEFPEEGIEWDLNQYQLILLSPRPEFFYTSTTSAGFIVIGRRSTDVWIYVESDIPPLKRVTAFP